MAKKEIKKDEVKETKKDELSGIIKANAIGEKIIDPSQFDRKGDK